MTEKHKRLDFDQVRARIQAERNVLEEKRIANGEKIARRIISQIADGRCEIVNGVIWVQFHIWQRGIGDYSLLTVKAVLKANGLMLSREHVFASDVLSDQGGLLPGRWFTARIELYVEPEPDPMEALYKRVDEILSKEERGNDAI